jgi:hypothetical protein
MSSKRKQPVAQCFTPASPADSARGHGLLVGWSERGTAAVLSLVLIGLHARVWLHAGGLWRDEINSVNLVAMSSLGDVWRNLQFDSFPMFWFLILRAWTFLVGESNLALRGLGLITGLVSVAAVWWTSRALTSRAPLVSLVLFSLTSTALIWGDSVRAFGLGTMLIVLTLGAMWRLVQSPTPWRIVAAGVAAVASVHCLYQNCVVLLGICLGASAVAASRHAWKLAILPLAIGGLAAVSMAPYLKVISQAGMWNVVMKVHVDLPWVFGKFATAIHPSVKVFAFLWLALALLALLASAWRLFRPALEEPAVKQGLAIFVLMTTVIVAIGYFSFLKGLSYRTMEWYYLPLMGVLTLLIEAGLGLITSATLRGRIVCLAVCIALAIPGIFYGWKASANRLTNVDLVTAELALRSPTNGDFVVVTPWFMGISFEYYYHGEAPWTTLPEINSHRLHRYDLLKEKMSQSDPIKPVLEKIRETLRSGHRVWLVGWPIFPEPGELAGDLPPAPNSRYGWDEVVYPYVWSRQAAFVLQSHATRIQKIKVPAGDVTNPLETAILVEAGGWRLSNIQPK